MQSGTPTHTRTARARCKHSRHSGLKPRDSTARWTCESPMVDFPSPVLICMACIARTHRRESRRRRAQDRVAGSTSSHTIFKSSMQHSITRFPVSLEHRRPSGSASLIALNTVAFGSCRSPASPPPPPKFPARDGQMSGVRLGRSGQQAGYQSSAFLILRTVFVVTHRSNPHQGPTPSYGFAQLSLSREDQDRANLKPWRCWGDCGRVRMGSARSRAGLQVQGRRGARRSSHLRLS